MLVSAISAKPQYQDWGFLFAQKQVMYLLTHHLSALIAERKRGDIMDSWEEYIITTFGSMEEFNKLPYQIRYSIWEDYMNGEE